MIQTPWELHGSPEYGYHTTITDEDTFRQALAATGRVAFTQIGTSDAGRPIWLWRLGGTAPPHYEPHSHCGLWVTSQHTRETSPREAMFQFVRDAAEGRDPEAAAYLAERPMFIIPTPDPDRVGMEADPEVVDNNRDHLLLTRPTTRAIATALQHIRPQLVADMHTGGVNDVDIETAQFAGVDPALRALGQDGVESVRAYLTAHGSTTGPLPVNIDLPVTFRNVAALRGHVAFLTETYGGWVMSVRIGHELNALRGILAWHAQAAGRVTSTRRLAALRNAGAPATSPAILGSAHAAYARGVKEVSPAPAAYRLTHAQHAEAADHLAAFNVQAQQSASGWRVPLNQATRPVIPLLLDPQSTQAATAGGTRMGHAYTGAPTSFGVVQIDGAPCPIMDARVVRT